MTEKQEKIKEKVEAFYADRRARNARFLSVVKRSLITLVVVSVVVGIFLLILGLSVSELSQKNVNSSAANNLFFVIVVGGGFGLFLYSGIAIIVILAIWKVVNILVKLGKKWKKEDEERDKLVEELVSLGCTRKEIEGYLSELSEVEVKECLDWICK